MPGGDSGIEKRTARDPVDLEVFRLDFKLVLFLSSPDPIDLTEELLDCGTVEVRVPDDESLNRATNALLLAESRDDIFTGPGWRMMVNVNYASCLKRSGWVRLGLCWLKRALLYPEVGGTSTLVGSFSVVFDEDFLYQENAWKEVFF